MTTTPTTDTSVTKPARDPEVAARFKALRTAMHLAAKTWGAGSRSHRYHLLAWAYLRGKPFRDVEARHRVQGDYEHNMPDAGLVWLTLARAGTAPLGAGVLVEHDWRSVPDPEEKARIAAWLTAEPIRAKPAPRVKAGYVQERGRVCRHQATHVAALQASGGGIPLSDVAITAGE